MLKSMSGVESGFAMRTSSSEGSSSSTGGGGFGVAGGGLGAATGSGDFGGGGGGTTGGAVGSTGFAGEGATAGAGGAVATGAACGFAIEDITPNGNYFDLVAQEVHRVKSMAQRYVGRKPNMIQRIAVKTVLSMLRNFSHAGHRSADLGCFGLHVRARRVEAPASSPQNHTSAA